MSANAAFGSRPVSILGHSGQTETTVLPPEATPMQATIIVDDEETDKRSAEGPQPLPTLTVSSRAGSDTVG